MRELTIPLKRVDHSLPLHGELVRLIETAQAKARTGLADPELLALRVVRQLRRVQHGAHEMGRTLPEIGLSGTFWHSTHEGPPAGAGVTTLVEIRSYPALRLVVRRAPPPIARNGALSLTLPEFQEA